MADKNQNIRDEPVIRFVDVTKSFLGREGRNVVLNKVSFSVPHGQTTVIAGGSGQGKSVTLKLVLGLMQPDSGRIFVDGKDVTRLRKEGLRRLRTKFGVLFQGSALFDSLTVFENVALPLRERVRLDEGTIKQKVMATLEQLDLTGHENKYPAQLSGGMRKRVGLARALQLDPEIVLFDEPTTGLDPLMTNEIYNLFAETQKRIGYTAVIVSHDIPKIFALADQIILLNKGEIDVFSSPEEIRHSSKPYIKEFIETSINKDFIRDENRALL
ncbi:MAG: ATP-binding cassette domain-containing protein [Desulfobulbaceae bacterium]|nr:ATP-binding cassette domain-containing protein [Desulfobulbaceae bacterium]